jgi:hypothetical protein
MEYTVASIYKKQASNDIDLSFNYFFRNKTVQNKVEVTLAKGGNTTYITSVDGKTSKRFGVELGLKKGVTFYNFGDHEFESESVVEDINYAPLFEPKAAS